MKIYISIPNNNNNNKFRRDEAIDVLKYHYRDENVDFCYLEAEDLQTSVPILEKVIKYMEEADKIVIMDTWCNLETGRATIESELAHSIYKYKVIESYCLENWTKEYKSKLSMNAEELKYHCVQAGSKALVYVKINDDEYAVKEVVPTFQDGVTTKITLVTKNKENEVK